MKTLLVGINAKFIHSNPAIRSLKAYTEKHTGYTVEIAEFTINQSIDFILKQIYYKQPDILGISCYIWNWTMVQELIPSLQKVLPQLQIILGGPEVSYDAGEIIRSLGVDFIISGEGESAFSSLLSQLQGKNPDLSNVPSLVYYKNGNVCSNSKAQPVALETIPFIYESMDGLENRILYYESSRGCPYRCSYCMSSVDNALAFLPLERVYKDLRYFLDKRVRQVKFVDRTFNCNKKHAFSILQFLMQQDNGFTNFHFEITADTLDTETIQLLQSARKGLFQLEIGVQSTNPQTLQAISRPCDLNKLSQTIGELQKNNNIHLHLDLIAGLPCENYQSFRNSFNDVHSLSPDQLQLGFLKLLKGSSLKDQKDAYGIVCGQHPPYEVLYTKDLPFDDFLKLKMMEEMVERYYNSRRYKSVLPYLYTFFETPFDLFEALAQYYEKHGYDQQMHSKEQVHTILYHFFQTLANGDEQLFKWLIKFDMYSHEKASNLPAWMDVGFLKENRQKIYDFYNSPRNREAYFHQYPQYDSKQLYRMTHLEIFPFHPLTGEKRMCCLLFDYKEKDILGNAKLTEVPLFS